MTTIDRLVAELAKRGIKATPEQAEAMALRLSGSVEAYLAEMEEGAREAAEYVPLEGNASDKFSEPVNYRLERPTRSGRLPPRDQS